MSSAQLQKSAYNLYTSLNATIPLAADSGLGGKLIYAGEFSNKELLYAANIAGAASIAASADPALQRQAIRGSVIDILVTSLEEALRILKNEIRKHQAVSVGVAIAPSQLVEQMLDRGVLPDLLPGAAAMSGEMNLAQEAIFLNQGGLKVAYPNSDTHNFVTWSIDRDFARALPQVDALAQATIPENDIVRQRWLRLAPRYLGRAAQRLHCASFTEQEFTQFKASVEEWKVRTASETGEAPALILQKSSQNSVVDPL